jgi:cysteine-rich repeat protein
MRLPDPRGPGGSWGSVRVVPRSALLSTLGLGVLLVACGDDIPLNPGGDTEGSGSGDPSTSTAPTTVTPPDDDTSPDPDTGPEPSTGGTGPSSDCGNGTVDPGEECDDENVDNGDACYADCRVPYTVDFTTSVHGGSDDDWLEDVVLDDAGNAYAVGGTSAPDGDTDLWVVQLLPDGTTGWTATYNGMIDGNDWGTAIAWLEGDLVVSGVEQRSLGRDGLVARMSARDGSLVWSTQIDGAGLQELGDELHAIAVAADGSIFVAGTMSGEGSLDASVARLGADGSVDWQVEYGEAGTDDFALALEVVGEGELLVSGVATARERNTGSWLRRIDDAGTELDVQNLAFDADDLAIDARGQVAISGRTRPGDGTEPQAVLELRDAGLATQWMAIFEGPSQGTDRFQSVAFLPDGDLVVAGGQSYIGEGIDVVIARYSASGDILWVDGYGGRLLLDDEAFAVVPDPEGDLWVVGSESTFDESLNGWVRRITQAPAP